MLILVMLTIGMVVFGVLAVVASRRRREGPEDGRGYYALFVLGICILPTGLILAVTVSPALLGLVAMGSAYIAIGLTYRERWEPLLSS